MKRLLAVLALGVAAVLGLAAPAAAHPLGNFTTNQYAGLRVGTSGVTIDYVIDLAELPAFQARRDEIGDALPAWAQHTCTAVAADTALTVDGQAARVAVRAARAESRPGSGGLETIRVECALRAEATIHEGTTVDYRGTAFENRIGWREVTAVGDRATLTGSSVPAATISGRLSAYPAGTGPLDIRAAHLLVRPGGPAAPAVAGFTDPAPGPGVTAWFDDLIGRPELTLGVGLLALLTAMVLGAAHAVAPGHGKTVMAAYLVAQRGRRKQALQLAGTVAAIHTLGVLVLAVALAASLEIAPAAMYGVLKLASGVLVAGLGVVLLRRAWVGRPLAAVGHRGHDGGHGHGHDHDGGH
ncbi:HoxN/HupN/NixA family nickel/cobalt transporter, partial [Asanoa ferruginea]